MTTVTDLWQMYTMEKRNAYVWLATGNLNAAMKATRTSLTALLGLRRRGDTRIWSAK